ncbi:MAG: hypothetical protein ING19_05325 [Azospirillum sp.]|nr:hypothetical protein [Azospirillum sp.]MCA3265473.1 hypothetical protein [Azospirillum sp.]
MSAPLAYRPDAGCPCDIERGEFCYGDLVDGVPRWLHFWPHDSKCPLSAAIAPHRNPIGASWTLSGTREAPTLSPSVNAKRCWHGFLVDGVARAC